MPMSKLLARNHLRTKKQETAAQPDRLEQAAERTANQVMDGQQGQWGAARSATPAASMGSENCFDSTVMDGVSSPGQELDFSTRRFMETRFGHDFSKVRVHCNESAARSAGRFNAQAYTVGRDLVFGEGQYQTHSRDGRNLLAHELSHVIQQNEIGRPMMQMRKWGEGEAPPVDAAGFRNLVIAEAQALVEQNAPTLGPAIRRVIDGTNEVASVRDILRRAESRSVGMTHSRQLTYAAEVAAEIVRTFILDPTTSSLDLLTAAQRTRFRNFAWDRDDYPGGTEGPNEDRADEMVQRLSGIRPPRRANLGDSAVVTRGEYNDDIERYILANLADIPDFPATGGITPVPVQPAGHRLYRDAQASFVTMRDAALADGVPLIIIDSYRDPAVARRRAEAAGNARSVASFSSHSLGLAVDMQMSVSYQDAAGRQQNLRYTETTTTPMQNVVDMRQSPAHKWMFLHGAQYGWFPYQDEPWHWEYNPEGFRDSFNAAVRSAQ